MTVRVRLVARRNGPYILFVNGKPRAVLCRCGASKRKPYCDGSHARIGFQADEAVIWEHNENQAEAG